MPFPSQSFNLTSTDKASGYRVHTVVDPHLANHLIGKGARVVKVDIVPPETLIHLEADVDLRPLIRQYHIAEFKTPPSASKNHNTEALVAPGDIQPHDQSFNAGGPSEAMLDAAALCTVRMVARRCDEDNRHHWFNRTLHECKRRIQAALANEKGRMRKAGLPEAEILAILEAAAGQLPEFITRLNAGEIS